MCRRGGPSFTGSMRWHEPTAAGIKPILRRLFGIFPSSCQKSRGGGL